MTLRLKIFFLVITIISVFHANPVKAQEENLSTSSNQQWVNYVPTIVTSPASYLATGTGYIIDGVFFLSGVIVIPLAVCGPIVVTIGAITNDGSMLGEVYQACSEMVLQNVDSRYYELGIGQKIYKETKSWRKPFRLIETEEDSESKEEI